MEEEKGLFSLGLSHLPLHILAWATLDAGANRPHSTGMSGLSFLVLCTGCFLIKAGLGGEAGRREWTVLCTAHGEERPLPSSKECNKICLEEVTLPPTWQSNTTRKGRHPLRCTPFWEGPQSPTSTLKGHFLNAIQSDGKTVCSWLS